MHLPPFVAPGSPGFLILCLGAAFVLVNLAAFAAFRADKRRAARGEWRIPERTLLLLAFLGGWPGAKLAQRQFRHKTRKQPFASVLNAVPLVWVLIAGGAVWLAPAGGLGRSVGSGLDMAQGVGSFRGVGGRDARALPRRFGPGSDATEVGTRDARALPRRFGPGSDGD